jgi:hypothetical protein
MDAGMLDAMTNACLEVVPYRVSSVSGAVSEVSQKRRDDKVKQADQETCEEYK